MPKTFSIVTLGCKVNRYESDRIAADLEAQGMTEALDGASAEVVVVNTCTVTGRAGQQSRQAVRAAVRANPDAIVIATGCHAQTDPGSLSGIENLCAVCGNSHKGELPRIIRTLGIAAEKPRRAEVFHGSVADGRNPALFDGPAPGRRARPVLRIQDGCNQCCSYCTVPLARGRSRSMEPGPVARHLAALYAQGFGEVVLTGIHIGAWGLDLAPASSLTALLEGLAGNPAELPALRISSIEPMELTDGIIDLARRKIVRPHFHLPLQSGDDGILRLMRRPYTAGQYAKIVNKVHDALPLAAIGADVMAGFPGETEAAFQNCLDLIEKLPVTYLHVFPFSPRKGTDANSMPGKVPPPVLKERTAVLRGISRKKRADFQAGLVGAELEICVEGPSSAPGEWKGITENYVAAVFECHGRLKPGSTVKGRIVEAASERPARAVLL